MKGDKKLENIESLFTRYKDDVYRLALSYTRSIQEAEDVCQSVFVKLMEQKHIQPIKQVQFRTHFEIKPIIPKALLIFSDKGLTVFGISQIMLHAKAEGDIEKNADDDV